MAAELGLHISLAHSQNLISYCRIWIRKTIHNNNDDTVCLLTEKDKRWSYLWKQVLKNTGLAIIKQEQFFARERYMKYFSSLKSHTRSIQGHVTNNQASYLKCPSGQLAEYRSYPSFCNGLHLFVLIPTLLKYSTGNQTRKKNPLVDI